MQLPEGTSLLISHTRGLPPALKKLLKRRQAIERTIGHMKTDGLLARNWLKGREGDAIHAVLCGAGHNLRLMLAQRNSPTNTVVVGGVARMQHRL